MTNCLSDIVCLPPWDPCWGAPPADWPGDSPCDGISITDPEYGFPLLDAVSEQTADMAEVLTEAKASAITTFATDLSVLLSQEYATLRTWSGRVGRASPSGTIATSDISGMKISPYGQQRDVYLSISTLYVSNGTGGAGQVTVEPFSEPSAAYTVDVMFGTSVPLKNVLSEPILLPLWSEDATGTPHYIYFSSTSPAPSIKVSCCGGAPAYKKSFSVSGVTGADLSEELHVLPGISFEGCTICDGLAWLCRCTPLQALAARAIAAAAGARLASVVLGSDQINSWTLLGADTVAARYDSLKASYENYLNTIVAQAPVSELCCYSCTGKYSHVRRSILV